MSGQSDEELLRDFIAEADSYLDHAEQNVLSLERNASDREAIHSLFRAFHTIEGVAGCIELNEIHSLANRTEDLLRGLRDHAAPVTPDAALVLRDAVDQMRHLVGDLEIHLGQPRPSPAQPSATSLGLLPISEAFARMWRVVAATAQQTGKQVELVVDTDGEVVLKRRDAAALGHALMHMVRNSVVHGIEPAAERKTAGKAEVGQIRLSARRERNGVHVRIADDGRGLDAAKILKNARSAGLVGGEAMSDAEAFRLIFHPGLSTAESVTPFSGRGVGMDVVKRTIEQLGGRIDIESVSGKDTCFTIRLP